MVKNCDLGLENASLGLVFSRPRSQFFTIRTSQPANNIYFLSFLSFKSLCLPARTCSRNEFVVANVSLKELTRSLR